MIIVLTINNSKIINYRINKYMFFSNIIYVLFISKKQILYLNNSNNNMFKIDII